MNLPFLKQKTWPRVGKPAGESRYGFSEDDDLIEHALDELMRAYESKDSEKILNSIEALVRVIQSREHVDAGIQEGA